MPPEPRRQLAPGLRPAASRCCVLSRLLASRTLGLSMYSGRLDLRSRLYRYRGRESSREPCSGVCDGAVGLRCPTGHELEDVLLAVLDDERHVDPGGTSAIREALAAVVEALDVARGHVHGRESRQFGMQRVRAPVTSSTGVLDVGRSHCLAERALGE